MRQAVTGFLRRAFVVTRKHTPVSHLSALACCLNSVDHQEPIRSSICSEYRSLCLLPLITLAVRTSNWDEARKISFRECVRLYGLSQSIGLFALLMQSFLPRRIREIQCLIQSIVDYCGDAGSELFELAPMLVSNLGGSMTLLQVYAMVIRVFVELSMFEDALLTYIEAKKLGVEMQLCNFLLKCLVKRNQIMYARSLFDDMKSSGPSPNVYSYSVLMSMYTHGDRLCLDEAYELLCEMETEGVRPNAVTYGTYLYGLCRARQVSSAWDFLQEICQRGYPCNNYCFNAVIHGFCHEGQVHKAKEVFDGMKEGGFVPDVHSYSILVDGLCKQGHLRTGHDMLVKMERNGITPTPVSYSSLLHGLCRAGKVELALELFKRLKDQGFKHDQIVYSIVLHGCCQHLDLEFAYDLWNDMIHHNFVPDVYNYTSLIYAFCRHRYLEKALGLFQLMLDNGISPNIVTCTILVDGFSKEERIGEAFLFLDKVRQFGIVPNLCTYRVIINGLCKVNKSNDAWEIFADMIKRGYLPDTVLYSIIIDGFVKALNLQEAFRLYHKMLDEGTEPNIFTYTSLINGLCHDDRLPEAMSLFKDMIGEELIPDRILYTSLIACYCKRLNMKVALEIFREMEKRGLSADAFVYTCLIGGYSKVLAMDGALWLMEEMINKGLRPTVVTYTDLIIGYFKTGDEKKANMMYNSMLQVFRKAVLFVVDTSGSMQGKPLENVKNAVSTALSELMQGDYFNIITFNNELHSFSSCLEKVNEKAIASAIDWMNLNFIAEGGTDIMHPLTEAMAILSSVHDALPQIFLMTDGSVDDEHNICQIVKTELINRGSKSPRVSTFGLGSYCNHYFLRMLASIGKGHYDAALETGSIESRILDWFRKASSTIVANISIDATKHLDEFEVDSEYIPDISAKCPLCVSGKYQGKFPETVTAKGYLADMREISFELKVQHIKDIPLDEVLAAEQIGLLTAKAWLSADKQLERKVMKLSKQNSIPSEYTSMVLLQTNLENVDTAQKIGPTDFFLFQGSSIC